MKARTLKPIPMLVLAVTCMVAFSGCSEQVTDFGFDGQLRGMVVDQNGNPVSGDIANTALTVFALGDGEQLPTEIRVQADGSYANLHLYPQAYTVWIEGPVVAPGEQRLDLTGDLVEHNITVTPFLTISQPGNATISGDQLSVGYEITESAGHVAEERVVLVSTVAKVGVNTGNGPRWQTRELTLDSNSGTATVTLDSDLLDMAQERGGGNLHIRVAARSDKASAWNLSIPVTISAP